MFNRVIMVTRSLNAWRISKFDKLLKLYKLPNATNQYFGDDIAK